MQLCLNIHRHLERDKIASKIYFKLLVSTHHHHYPQTSIFKLSTTLKQPSPNKTNFQATSTEHLSSSRSIKSQLRRWLPGSLLVERDVVVELLGLSSQLSSGILSLRSLDLKLQASGSQLQHLVLYFAVGQCGLSVTGGCCDLHVESIGLGVVGDVVHGA